MTQNKLCTRLAGHKTHMRKLEQYLQNVENSDIQIADLRGRTALMEHAIDHQHKFNLERTKIVDRSNSKNTLAFLEMGHIFNTQHTVNRRVDVEGLNTAYAGLLHTIKLKSNQTQSTSPNISFQNSLDSNHTENRNP